METLIRLLPDHLANQIAAGEVVQRPASVVKELLENAVDAGATKIELLIRDAGKALVQVMDNGSGMSAVDARMSFERHATSKIREKDDLFNIRTLGFRGEALASIAAVAQVNMKTRKAAEELGTEIRIDGGEILHQGPCAAQPGTTIAVKNLFFNVPARRNFLKSNPVETKHILSEFTHVALSHPEIAFRLEHNDTLIYDLKGGSLSARIMSFWGDDLNEKLIPVEQDTQYVKLHGFTGTPETARKARGEQLFFVNGRFIRSPYLQHAVASAYQDLIASENFPLFCIFIDIDPVHVDINIHPTKTEVKFDDERAVYLLLSSVVRKAIAGFHQVPETGEDSALVNLIRSVPLPRQQDESRVGGMQFPASYPKRENVKGWEDLYRNPSTAELQKYGSAPQSHAAATELFSEQRSENLVEEGFLVQLQNNYLLSQVKSGMMVIDPVLAHQRVLYERFLSSSGRPPIASQQMLFPQTVRIQPADLELLMQCENELRHLGFDFRRFNPDSLILHGTPADIQPSRAESVLMEIVAEARERGEASARDMIFERISRKLAQAAAMKRGTRLNPAEARKLVDELFQTSEPRYAPNGNTVFFVMSPDELGSRFFS